jgi:hypothetical protein
MFQQDGRVAVDTGAGVDGKSFHGDSFKRKKLQFDHHKKYFRIVTDGECGEKYKAVKAGHRFLYEKIRSLVGMKSLFVKE